MFLHVSGSGMSERIFLQFVPPANVCIWDTFGDISCYTDSGSGKRLKEEACKHLVLFESKDAVLPNRQGFGARKGRGSGKEIIESLRF